MLDKLTMEAILFQRGRNFPETLDNNFQSCIDDYPNIQSIEHTLESLSVYIKKETGINFIFKFDNLNWVDKVLNSRYKIGVDIPTGYTFNPLDVKNIRKMETLDFTSFKPTDVLNGSIDYKNAKVSGCFSEIEFTCWVTDIFFSGGLTAQDITAVALHELGHAWDFLDRMGTTLITSAFVTVATGQLREDLPVDRRIQIGTALVKAYGLHDDITEEMANQSVVVGLLLNNPHRTTELRTGRKYEPTRYAEILADQFVSRWGRGTSAMSALLKLEGLNSFTRIKSAPKWIGAVSTLLQAGWVARGIVKGVKLGRSVPSLVVGAVVTEVIGRAAFESLLGWMVPGGNHPTRVERIEMLRLDSVGMLKEDLPKDIRKKVLEDLEEYDRLLDEAKSNLSTYNRLANYLAGVVNGRWKRHYSERTQMAMINNPLYELEAVLKG